MLISLGGSASLIISGLIEGVAAVTTHPFKTHLTASNGFIDSLH